MNQDKIKQQQRLFEELNSKSCQGPAQIQQFQCYYCLKFFKNFKTRANHWTGKNQFSHFHKILRAEELLQKLECIGCLEIYNKKGNCQKHLNNCDLVDKTQIQESKFLIQQKQLEQCSYQSIKILKNDKYPNVSELKIPKYITMKLNVGTFAKSGTIIIMITQLKEDQSSFAQMLGITTFGKIQTEQCQDLHEHYSLQLFKTTHGKVQNRCLIICQITDQDKYLQLKCKRMESYSIGHFTTLKNNGPITLMRMAIQLKNYSMAQTNSKMKFNQQCQPSIINGVKGYFNQAQLDQIPEEIWAERTSHSQKPQEFWDVLDQLIRGVIRLEIFTRSDLNKPNTVHVGIKFKGDKDMKIKQLY
ncbi:MT-A70 family protein [Oxytricha trifallax]|uniref:MT-A70 family protein n=1 Tax=Oxytricha trifallax TaxID=1172189 RepID=A0A073I0V1_9SPIT|nr:MT-A70 family protein [Oxytricha trifallax]